MTDNKKTNNWLIKKIFKRILGFWIFWLLFLGINNNNYTHAQTTTTAAAGESSTTTQTKNTLDESLQKTKSMLDIILKMIYMLSRPIIVIAWKAMDNSLVYWSIFHLDAPLWKFWNIMKNFANYALWFILLFNILKSLFSVKWIDKTIVVWIVKNILIAGILIQASRFLLSAVIDISTIATYAVGWMPLTILKNSNLWDQKILWVNSTMNIWDSKSTTNTLWEDTVIYRTYGSNPEYKIASCRTSSWDGWKYIMGKQINFITQSWSNSTWWIALEKWMCVLWWIPYKFNEFTWLASVTTNAGYKKALDDIIWTNATLSWFEECWFIIPLFSKTKYDPSKCDPSWSLSLLSTGNFWYSWWSWRLNSITDWTTLSTLIDKSKWFVGPLITIYSSTLNFGTMWDTSEWWDSITFGIVLKFMIKAFIGIMLILPILALAIIMFARVGILWMAIAFSPIIIIKEVFKVDFWKDSKLLWALELKNLIRLIFAPVLVIFGLSISLIFMSTLSSILSQNESQFDAAGAKTQKQSTLEWLWITQPPEQPNCYSVLTQTFCSNLDLGWWLDNISYLLINIFGIAIMWTLLFWTIKQTWSIWESVWKSIQETWQKIAGNIPIVPIAWWVWINQIAWTWRNDSILDKMNSKITTNMSNENEKRLWDAFPWLWFKKREDEDWSKDKWSWSTTSTNNPVIDNKQIEAIVTETTKWANAWQELKVEKLKELIWKETDGKIKDWIGNRIKEPENVKLLFERYEKLNTAEDKNNFVNAIKPLLDINNKMFIDYKDAFKDKDINTIIKDLDNSKLEALVTVTLNEEITLKDNKKYKIKKKSDWKYESEEITS